MNYSSFAVGLEKAIASNCIIHPYSEQSQRTLSVIPVKLSAATLGILLGASLFATFMLPKQTV